MLNSASHLEGSTKVKIQKDTIELDVNMITKAIQHSCFKIQKLTNRRGLTPCQIRALNDCLEMVYEKLDELGQVTKGLKEYDAKKSLKRHTEDLKIISSSAITDPETCLDRFSHDNDDKKVHKELENSDKRVEKMCSNALGIICNMTNTDIANENKLNRRNLMEEHNTPEWPKWFAAIDIKLLQSETVTPNVFVAADADIDYKTGTVRRETKGGYEYHNLFGF